jgi:integrase
LISFLVFNAKAKVPYKDKSGKYADFHSLRHTFVSNLSNAGVYPSAAQSLARHCDINTTMSYYTHVGLENQIESLGKLPEFTNTEDNKEDEKTG